MTDSGLVAIHPLLSYSADADTLAEWWKRSGNPDWVAQRLWLGSILFLAGLGVRFMLKALGQEGPA